MKIEDEIKQTKFKSAYHKLILNLIYTGHWIEDRNSQLLKEWGLTVQQFNILRILRGQMPNPATVKLLQERMLDRMSNASRIVDKLVAKELVHRCENETDRREVKITITSKGLDILTEIDKHIEKSELGIERISETEAEKISDFLDNFRDILEK